MFSISKEKEEWSTDWIPSQIDEPVQDHPSPRKRNGKKINRPSEYNYPQKCEFCHQIFLEKEMVRHKNAHPESFTMDCIPCGKFFRSKSAYDAHYNIHKVYHCVMCKKDFNARKHYRSHMERIHKAEGERPRVHECDICHKTFKDKFVLNTHKKTHSGEKAHKCPMCDYACNNMTYMRQHVLNHTHQLQFKCHFCYRGFVSDEGLQLHINKLHANEPRIYKCDICGKISTSKGNLRQHQKTHDPDYNQKHNHKCPDCGKTFALQCRLRKHLISHKEPKEKVHCSICSKLLSRDSYKKHLKAHSGEKSFLCDYCGESFATNSCLMVHRRTHTGDKLHKPAECSQCVGGQIGEDMRDVLSHKSQLPLPQFDGHPCQLCGKAFTDQASLQTHRNTYHTSERPFIFISYTSQQ